MSINIKPSHEGRFHKWAKVPNGQEIPMSKIKQGERSPDPAVRKEAHFAYNARPWSHGNKA
jgi:oligoendopeptidase F